MNNQICDQVEFRCDLFLFHIKGFNRSKLDHFPLLHESLYQTWLPGLAPGECRDCQVSGGGLRQTMP